MLPYSKHTVPNFTPAPNLVQGWFTPAPQSNKMFTPITERLENLSNKMIQPQTNIPAIDDKPFNMGDIFSKYQGLQTQLKEIQGNGMVDALPQQLPQTGKQPRYDDQVLMELKATVLKNPNDPVAKYKYYFPELQDIDDDTFDDLVTTMAGNPWASLEDIYNAFPELLDGGEEQKKITTAKEANNVMFDQMMWKKQEMDRWVRDFARSLPWRAWDWLTKWIPAWIAEAWKSLYKNLWPEWFKKELENQRVIWNNPNNMTWDKLANSLASSGLWYVVAWVVNSAMDGLLKVWEKMTTEEEQEELKEKFTDILQTAMEKWEAAIPEAVKQKYDALPEHEKEQFNFVMQRGLDLTDVYVWWAGSKVAKEWLEQVTKQSLKAVDAWVSATKAVWKKISSYTENAKKAIETIKSWMSPEQIKKIESNPYQLEYRWQTLEKIEKDGITTNLNRLKTPLNKELWSEVTTAVSEIRAGLAETSPLYGKIKELNTPIIVKDAKNAIANKIDDMWWVITPEWIVFDDGALAKKWITITSSDKTNINTLWKTIDEIETMTPAEVLGIRKTADKFAKWEVKNPWDWPNIIKSIRKEIDEVAKKQVPELAKLDEYTTKMFKAIDELEDGLVYLWWKKKWQLRDNFNQIINTLWWDNRAKMLARLEEVMPDLRTRVEAIDNIPMIAKAYTDTSKLQNKLAVVWWVWWLAAWWISWWVWWLIAWYIWSNIVESAAKSVRQSTIDSILRKVTPEAKKTLQTIESKLKNKKTLQKSEKQFLENIENNISKIKDKENLTQELIQAFNRAVSERKPALPEKVTIERWTPKNPYVGYDLRDPEIIKRQKERQKNFTENKEAFGDWSIPAYRSKAAAKNVDSMVDSGMLYTADGEKIIKVLRTPHGEPLGVKVEWWKEIRYPKVYKLTDPEIRERDWFLQKLFDEDQKLLQEEKALKSDIKKKDEQRRIDKPDIEEMTDAQFLKHIEKADPNDPKISKEYNKRFSDSIEINNPEMIKEREFRARADQITEQEKNLWFMFWKKLKDQDTKRGQQQELLRKREKLVEDIMQHYNIDQFQAFEKFDEWVDSGFITKEQQQKWMRWTKEEDRLAKAQREAKKIKDQPTTPQENLSPAVKTQEKQAKVAPKKIAEAMKPKQTQLIPTDNQKLPEKISQSLAKKEKGSIVDGMNNKELQPLYNEAKKYKSADDFVKTKDTVYHWSPYKFDEFNANNIGKSVWSDKDWIFFTNSKVLADRYTYNPQKDIKWWIINASVDFKKPLEIETKQTPLSYFTSNKDKIIKQAKKWWHDGIKIYDKAWDENIIISLDPKNIKTETQLRQIREEANNKWLKPKTMNERITQPVARVKAPEEPLIAEARKYKSADEFVRSTWKKVYHWTPDMRFAEEFDPTKKWYYKNNPEALPDNKKFTEAYWGIKLWFENETLATKWKAIYFTDNTNVARDYSNKIAFDNDDSIPWILTRNVILKKPLVVDAEWQLWRKFETTIDWEKIVWTRNLEEFARKKWYDWLIVRNVYDPYNIVWENISKSQRAKFIWTNYAVFDPKQIKSETQLRKIREEANKTLKK